MLLLRCADGRKACPLVSLTPRDVDTKKAKTQARGEMCIQLTRFCIL